MLVWENHSATLQEQSTAKLERLYVKYYTTASANFFIQVF